MKILIMALLFTTSVFAERPAQRMIKEAFSKITSAASPCSGLAGLDVGVCTKEYAKQKAKMIKSMVTLAISDVKEEGFQKVKLEIKEEKAVVSLRGWLDSYSITYTAVEDSVSLQAKKTIKLAELEEATCVALSQTNFEYCQWAYVGGETCAEFRVLADSAGECTPVVIVE